MTKNLPKLCIIFTNAILAFTIAILLFSTLFYIFKIPIQTYILIPAILVTCLFVFWNSKYYFEKHHLIPICIILFLCLVLFAAALLICSRFRELPSDGQTYQTEARLLFANGFNPFYDHTADARIDQYPIGPWVYGTIIYLLTGSIDSSRIFNILFWAGGIFAAFAYFASIFKKNVSLVIFLSLICVLNPVVITQSLSFYVDGQFTLMLLIVIAFSLLLSNKFDPPVLLGLVMAVILAINIKLTGILYVGILGGGILFWDILFNRWIPGINGHLMRSGPYQFIKYLWKSLNINDKMWITGLAGSGAIGVGFFGYPAYIQPPFEYGSFIGYFNKWDQALLKINQLPSNWVNLSALQKFVLSLFSESMVTSNIELNVKWPLMFSKEELISFIFCDHLSGGFGPLFGSVIGITILAIPFVIILAWRSKNHNMQYLLGLPLLIIISTLVTSMPWISRFVPQFWWFPIFIVASLLLLNDRLQAGRCIAWIIIAFMFYNSFLVSFSNYSQHRQVTIELNNQFNLMKKEGKREPLLFYNANRTYLSTYLKENNVQFISVKDSKGICPEGMIKSKLPYPVNDAWFCFRN